MQTTVGKVLLKANVPQDMHAYIDTHDLDKNGISKFFDLLAEKHPNDYAKIVSNLTRLGFEVSTRLGSTVRLADLKSPIDKNKYFKELNAEVSALRKKEKDPKKFEAQANDLYQSFVKKVTHDLVDVGVKQNQTLAKIIRSGSRGSPVQYMQTVFAPVLVQDAEGKPLVNFPITRSFSEGLSLPEYLATSFGSRSGEVAKKLSIAEAGYFCLTGKTSVLMADRSVKDIKDIKVGDMVIGVDPTTMTATPTEVTAVFDHGPKPCNRYTFRRINSTREWLTVEATEEHKILARHLYWGKQKHRTTKFAPIPFKELLSECKARKSKGGWLPELPPKPGKTEHRALMLGLMLGDGCWTQSSSMLFSCADQALLDETREYFASLNYEIKRQSKEGYNHRLNFITRPKKKIVGGRVYSGDAVRQWLQDLGLWGTYSHNKFIPKEVWSWDSASIAALIGGLYSTDGNISPSSNNNQISIRLAMVSKQVVEQVQELLFRVFGIPSSVIRTTDKLKLDGALNDLYTLSINHRQAIERFAKSIPLYGAKRIQLTKLLLDFPVGDNNTELPCTFVGHEPVGVQHTYDIEVAHPSHLFMLANGLIVSNSKQISRAGMTIKVEEHDCGTNNGVSASTSAKDHIGAFLAQPVGGYNKNNEVTSKMLNDLANRKIAKIIVRSPITCQSSRKFHHNAVCQICAGRREKGLPQVGDYIGITAAQSAGEPLAQGQLCLSEDTEVRMADYSVKKIKDINVGDKILGADRSGNTCSTTVVEKFDQGVQECQQYDFSVGNTRKVISLVATPSHKILCNVKKWSGKAENQNHELQVLPLSTVGRDFNAILPSSYQDGLEFVGEPYAKILEGSGTSQLLQCYDLMVDHPDHLFVLANGLIVSNSLKHTSGSATGPNLTSGFDLIKQLATIPQTFKDKAAVVEHDGVVSKIRVAPQGGHYIDIGKDQYYVPTGFGIKVKVGDHVEAGDVLSDGIVNPADIVRLKGVGEGRRYYAETMKRTFDDSGMGGINVRNFEVLSKGMIDHVRVTDNHGVGEYLPGAIVSYQSVEKDYQPRPDAAKVRVDLAHNKYLEEPILHFTIGTRVTKKVIDQLKEHNISSVLVSATPPPFTPEMQRIDAIPEHEPDWMHQLYTANLERKILHAANTGAFSDLHGPSPVPGLAYGLGFGQRRKP